MEKEGDTNENNSKANKYFEVLHEEATPQ